MHFVFNCVEYIFVFFFFSSRRRHTRFDCDWSSDVCSSDLEEAVLRLLVDRAKKFDGTKNAETAERVTKTAVVTGQHRERHLDFHPEHLSARDRKSTRLNSSHSQISYAVFCLKKKKSHTERNTAATGCFHPKVHLYRWRCEHTFHKRRVRRVQVIRQSRSCSICDCAGSPLHDT